MAVFGEKRSSGSVERKTSTIGSGLTIKGNVKGEGHISVHGTIDGHLDLSGACVVEENGVVQGDIDAESITVAGRVAGNTTAKNTVELRPTGRVEGDITVPRISIADGASINGKVTVGRSK